uniref:Uncharacterized protein n=1 Tax=Rhizophora mucronata TaxID=61149 RepID=A0A2P2PSW1_RHIMU
MKRFLIVTTVGENPHSFLRRAIFPTKNKQKQSALLEFHWPRH